MAEAWARRAGRRILALTVDHGLQSQSAAWTRFAAATARGLGVDFQALDWTGPKPAAGLPAAARRARHALLAKAARDAGAEVILLGHTLDDELEARLMRREGSTLGAMSEWSPSPVWPEGRGLFLLRPLLAVRRATLRAWLKPTGLGWIEDPANDDPGSRRAVARKRLQASGDLDQPDQEPPERCDVQADLEALARGAQSDGFGVIRVDRDALRTSPADAVRRFTALACVCAGGGERRPRGGRVGRLAERLAGRETFTAALAGARIEADGDRALILRDAGESARGGLAPLELRPGVAAVWDGRFEALTDAADVTILALRGRLAGLSAAGRAALKEVPAAARPALPGAATRGDGESLTCPIPFQGGKVHVRCLVGRRLTAACGMIAHEADANLRH